MSGIKIINVLKDDSLGEIMELFRQAPSGEVIFVLPKTCKAFSSEDHFAAFASEATGADKTVTLMTSSEKTAALARKYRFTVMPSGKPSAKLASAPPPADDDIIDTSVDGVQDDVVETSDASMGIDGQDTVGTDASDELEGFRIVGSDGEPVDDDDDGVSDRPRIGDAQYGDLTASTTQHITAQLAAAVDGVRRKKATPRPPAVVADVDIPVRRKAEPVAPPIPEPESATELAETMPMKPSPLSDGDLDYIDAVWRDKVAQQSQEPPLAAAPVVDGWLARMRRPSATMPRGRSTKTLAVGALAVAVIVLGAVIYFTTGSAKVTVTPMAKPLQYTVSVQASDAFTEVDAAFGKIPGQLIEVTKSAQSTVPASGQRDVASKARGKITVYNEYSSTPQTLVATTRFMTPDGKIYRTLQTVTVPGSTVQAGAPVAGTVIVDVIADKAGADYNIPAGSFIIAAFQEKGDTERVKKIYGKSEQVMSGGASGPSQVVTEADYAKALEQATGEVRSQMKQAIEAQGADLIVLQTDNPPLDDPQATAQPDDAASEVTVTVSSTLKSVAFRNADLLSLIRDTIAQKERQVVLPERLTLTFKDVSYKEDTGVLGFTVSIEGTAYAPLDTAQIAADIAGKDGEMVRSYFRGRSDIGSADVKLTPFWVSRVPSEIRDITVELSYDDVPRL
jgi:hypothetical protein